jgi:hypothetical protein
MRHAAWIVAALGLLGAAPTLAETVHRERVHFEHGATGTTIRDRITGRDSIEYSLGLRAGQTLQVTLDDRRGTLAFNIFGPGAMPGRDAALFIGSTSGNEAELRLAASGDHMIQVYQVRAAARRAERGEFSLRIAVTAGGTAAAPATDARVGGTPFHATGTIPCARAAGQPMAQCRFGVVRHGAGAAEVTIVWPDGGSRVIGFTGGRPTAFGLTAADAAARPVVRQDADLFRIDIGQQRFEIPEAVVTGG